MVEQVPSSIIKKLAKSEQIDDYDVTIHDGNKKGEGFLGDMTFISLTNKTNGKVLHLVIKNSMKTALLREKFPIRNLFLNEGYFYQSLWPELLTFQKAHGIEPVFNLAKCYLASDEPMNEYVVLENLKSRGYNMFPKNQFLNKDHFKYIYRRYAKLHAIGFAYKKLCPGKFENVRNNIRPVFETEHETFMRHGRLVCKELYGLLKPEDGGVYNAYKDYAENGWNIFKNTMASYTGNYSTLLHGDCWNNNTMYIFDNERNIIDMTLIDFQVIRTSTPVFDLAYMLYSGATKDILDSLNELLDAYYDSFSKMLSIFSMKAEEVYPLSVLKEEWRQYSKACMIFSFLIWTVRMKTPEEVLDASELVDRNNDNKMMEFPKNHIFHKIVRDLILHVYEINAL